MIIELQRTETNLVSGGRFLPGLTRRLNNWVGKPLESVGKAVKKVFHEADVGAHRDGNGKWSYDAHGKVIGNIEAPNAAPIIK